MLLTLFNLLKIMSEQYSVLSYLAGKQILDGAWGGLL